MKRGAMGGKPVKLTRIVGRSDLERSPAVDIRWLVHEWREVRPDRLAGWLHGVAMLGNVHGGARDDVQLLRAIAHEKASMLEREARGVTA